MQVSFRDTRLTRAPPQGWGSEGEEFRAPHPCVLSVAIQTPLRCSPDRCDITAYLSGGQLWGPPAVEGEDTGPHRSAARLEIYWQRLLRLRVRHFLSVQVCRHHGNWHFSWYHRDGDALTWRLDEGQWLCCPHGTSLDQILWGQRRPVTTGLEPGLVLTQVSGSGSGSGHMDPGPG